jgi:hypothetical protein
MRPQQLNAAIASLFVVGSACFVLSSIPAYLNAIGGVVDSITYVVGSIFFTSASCLQLLQAHSPSMTDVERARDDRVLERPARVVAVADSVVQHGRVDLLHGLGSRQLHPAELG